MKLFAWDPAKNELLIRDRGVSFEVVVASIESGGLLDIIENPSPQYQHQEMFVVRVEDYVYLVPFVEDITRIFLKTIIPSRKLTKRYLLGGI